MGIRHSVRSSPQITVASYQELHLSRASTTSPFLSLARHSSGSLLLPSGAIFSLSIVSVIGGTEISFSNLSVTESKRPLYVSLFSASTLATDHICTLNYSSCFNASTLMSTCKFSRHSNSSLLNFVNSKFCDAAFPALAPSSF